MTTYLTETAAEQDEMASAFCQERNDRIAEREMISKDAQTISGGISVVPMKGTRTLIPNLYLNKKSIPPKGMILQRRHH